MLLVHIGIASLRFEHVEMNMFLCSFFWFKPSSKIFTDRSKAVLFLWIICGFISCVSHAFTSVRCCFLLTCWERADLLALVGDVYCIFVTFPCNILGHVWYIHIIIIVT